MISLLASRRMAWRSVADDKRAREASGVFEAARRASAPVPPAEALRQTADDGRRSARAGHARIRLPSLVERPRNAASWRTPHA